ncbi:HAMP domain-containing sensor histidine kinase [Desulfuromonas versatilis]|nr:ATP-binding protein [Desulfuromonas versatilis]
MALALLPLLALDLLVAYRSEEILGRRVAQELQVEVETGAEALEVYLAGIRRDLLALARFLERRLEPRAEAPGWEEVQEEFYRVLQAENAYYQVRYLDSRGMERIRVNNLAGRLVQVPESELQDKADRYYWREAMQTAPGEVYLSHLDANIEYGVPEDPLRLVVRLATVVADGAGRKRGVVIINVFGDQLLRALTPLRAGSGTRVILLGDNRRFVEMSRSATNLQFVSGRQEILEAELGAALAEGSSLGGNGASIGRERLVAEAAVHPGMDRQWRLLKIVPGEQLFSEITGLRRTLAFFGLLIGLGAALLALAAARQFSRPIRRLSRYALRVAEGDFSSPPAIGSRDELGRLAGSLAEMGRSLAESRDRLVDWNLSLQQEVDRKVAALRESEERYRLIFSSESDAILIFEAETRALVEANRAAAELYGYALDEFAGLCLEDLLCDVEQGRARLARVLAGTLSRIELTYHRKKDGSVFPAEVSAGTFRWGGKLMLVGIVRDISERLEIDRMKDEMLAAVSHEMRTPLTAMMGFAEFMLDNPVAEAEAREYLGIILKETDRLHGLIDNLLSFQRLRAGYGGDGFAGVSLEQLLEEVAELFGGPSSRRKLVLDCQEGLPAVHGDAELLRQAVGNLVSNAVKYSPPGTRVTLGARAAEGWVTLRVEDQGQGIPPAVREQIFDRFFRIDRGGSKRVGGTGLGLPLVKEIARLHGGRVRVESSEGEGSTFFLELPVAGPGRPQPQRESSSEAEFA